MENVKNKIVGIVSPPYEEAVDGGGIFKKGYVGNYPHSKNPDTVGNRTYSNKTHNFSDGQIGSLKSNQKEELDFDITKYHKCLSDLYWYGCYEGDAHFKQYFEPSTYSHPAKISPLLADRIFKHLEKLELLKEGMTVLDFMSGSGRVPLLASLRGYKSIGVELEPHFVKMCNDNKKFAENKIGRKLDMEIIQGDSRQLSKLLNKSDVAVVSPPYANPRTTSQEYDDKYDLRRPEGVAWGREGFRGRYGDNKENIGNLPYVAVVSPPFASTDCARHDDPESYKKYGDNIYRPNQMPMPDNPDNIANLPYKQMVGVVSPPYQDAIVNFENDAGKKRVERLRQAGFDRKNSGMIRSIETKSEVNAYKGFSEGYSQNPENIGNLKDKGSIVGITSPPYVAQSGGHNVKGGHIDEGLLKRSSAGRVGDDRYTQTEGNIANLKD